MADPQDSQIPSLVAPVATDQPLANQQPAAQGAPQQQQQGFKPAYDQQGNEYTTTDGKSWVNSKTGQPYVPHVTHKFSGKPAFDEFGKQFMQAEDGKWYNPQTNQEYKVPVKEEKPEDPGVLKGLYDNTIGQIPTMAQSLADYYHKKKDEAGGGVIGGAKAISETLDPGAVLTSGVGNLAENLMRHPTDTKTILQDAIKNPEHPVAKMVSDIVKSHIDTAKKTGEQYARAVEAAKQGDTKSALEFLMKAEGYQAATVLPVLGPAAARAGEDFQDKPKYALGEGLGLVGSVLAPEGVKAGTKLVKGAVSGVAEGVSSTLRPTVDPETGVPVRNKGAVASTLQRMAPEQMQKFYAEHTSPAVARGVGDVAKEATGSNATTVPTEKDPMGLLGHANDLEKQAQPQYQKINEWSNNKYDDYKKMRDDNVSRSTAEEKARFNEANDALQSLRDVYSKKFPDEAESVNEMEANWRRGQNLKRINSKLSAGAVLDKDGNFTQSDNFAKQVGRMIRKVDAGGKNVFERADFSPEQIDKLKNFADLVSKEGNVTKLDSLTTSLSKLLLKQGVSAGVGFAVGGPLGAPVGMAAEVGAEKLGGFAVKRLFGKILSTPEAVDDLANALKNGTPPETVAKSPWFQKFKETLKGLYQDESGEFVVPGTGGAESKPTPVSHWSNQEGLTETDPDKFSTGKMGAERSRTKDPGFVPRTYFGMEGYREPEIQSMPHKYSGNIDISKYYDIADDPKGIWQEAFAKGGATAAEKAVKDAGYSGYFHNNTVASFEKVPVRGVAKNVQDAADSYNKSVGKPAVDHTKVGTDIRGQHVADAYDEMEHNPTDHAVGKSYDALIKETKDQWEHLKKQGYTISVSDTDPYKSYEEMAKDVKDNKHITVWTGGQPPLDHPMSGVDAGTGLPNNTLFRAVHDIMGHVAGGNDFSELGEENAYNAHRQSYSKDAIPALTTETKGQTSWFFNNKDVRGGAELGRFPEQKAGLLPEQYHGNWSEDKVLDYVKSGKDFAILQAENPGDKRLPDAENLEKTQKLLEELHKRGHEAVPVGGNTKDVEGVTEHAFFVPGISPAEAAELGRKFGQNGIFTNEGLHDLKADTITPSNPRDLKFGADARAQQYFTSVGSKDFHSPLDFDKTYPASSNGHLSGGGLSAAGKKILSDAANAPYKPIDSFADAAEYLPQEDIDRLTTRMKDNIVKQLKQLGDPSMIEEAAKAGSVQRGWYQRTGDLIRGMFGDDAKRFIDVLAAMSSLKSVEQNFIDAFDFHGDWVAAGKPVGPEGAAAIDKLLAGRDLGLAGKTMKDNVKAILVDGASPSGPKVSNFAKNLQGEMNSVTKDRWVAYLLGKNEKFFKGLEKGQAPGSNFLASDIMIRQVAKRLNILPAEVQESGWSFLRTVLNMAEEKGITPDESARTVTESDIKRGASEFTQLVDRDRGIQVALDRLADRTRNESFRPGNLQKSPLYQSILEAARKQQAVSGGIKAANPEILARTAERAAAARSGTGFDTSAMK